MIQGNRATGYFVTGDDVGRRIEGETRQCVHCQFTWVYKPGSGNKVGVCNNCMGLVCSKPACHKGCAPFWDIANNMDQNYKLDDESGIFIRK